MKINYLSSTITLEKKINKINSEIIVIMVIIMNEAIAD